VEPAGQGIEANPNATAKDIYQQQGVWLDGFGWTEGDVGKRNRGRAMFRAVGCTTPPQNRLKDSN
jgi:hypothetical protein